MGTQRYGVADGAGAHRGGRRLHGGSRHVGARSAPVAAEQPGMPLSQSAVDDGDPRAGVEDCAHRQARPGHRDAQVAGAVEVQRLGLAGRSAAPDQPPRLRVEGEGALPQQVQAHQRPRPRQVGWDEVDLQIGHLEHTECQAGNADPLRRRAAQRAVTPADYPLGTQELLHGGVVDQLTSPRAGVEDHLDLAPGGTVGRGEVDRHGPRPAQRVVLVVHPADRDDGHGVAVCDHGSPSVGDGAAPATVTVTRSGNASDDQRSPAASPAGT